MPSSILNSDDGVISGTSGLKSSGGDDGVLVFQSKGTETARINTDKQIVAAAGTASLPVITTTGDLNTGIFFPAADTIAFAEGGAEAMRINSSGNVGIGTTSPATQLNLVKSASNAVGPEVRLGNNANTAGDTARLSFAGGTGLSLRAAMDFTVATSGEGIISWSNGEGTLTERARITSGGAFLVGTTSDATSQFRVVGSPVGDSAQIINNSGTFTNSICNFSGNRNTTNGTWRFLTCFNAASATDRLYILDSGNVQNVNNSYGSLSDVKLKQDIVDAGSQWDDIKGLRVRKFRWKSDPDGFMQIGLVAQEAEEVSPGLIDESSDFEEVEVTDEEGNVTTERQATGTTTKAVKYSVLYMKAVKALQEAIERIETLEAKNDALEARLSALEQA